MICFICISCLMAACGKKSSSESSTSDSIPTKHSPELPDTLKVVTLYGPTSLFDYRGELMGIDYENAKRFADDQNMEISVKTADNIRDLIDILEKGEAHLAAYPIPIIAEYNDKVIHCGHKEVSRQVIVQRSGDNTIKDVTGLIGKEIFVENESKYHFRLNNLNEELGGGIIIRPVVNDTIDSEDLMRMVAKGEIDYTVVDSNIASLYQPAFPNLDTSLAISADQAASWAVAPGLDALAESINGWENRTNSSQFVREIYRQYYETALSDNFDTNLSYFKERHLEKGNPVSDYDAYFKKHAATAGFDWELLAAIAYCESRYNTNIASRFGAYGLMQVMPASARAMGIDSSLLGNPDSNVLAAAKILRVLDESLEKKVPDREERIKFVLAAYNAGLGHINDAIALADKVGLDSGKWTGGVSVAALMKSRPEYYNDPVVRCGFFRGRETVDFVDHISTIYRYLKKTIPQKK